MYFVSIVFPLRNARRDEVRVRNVISPCTATTLCVFPSTNEETYHVELSRLRASFEQLLYCNLHANQSTKFVLPTPSPPPPFGFTSREELRSMRDGTQTTADVYLDTSLSSDI